MKMFRRWSDRRRIRRLAGRWQCFRTALEPWFDADTRPPARLERAFLATKSHIALELPVLGQVHGSRALEQEALAAMRDMTELMNRMSGLGDAATLDATERDSLVREWHVLYIFLNKLEGTLTGSAADGVVLAAGEGPGYLPAAAAPRGGSGLLGFVTRALVVALLLVAVAMVLGIDGDDILSRLPGSEGSDGAVVAQAPTGETEVPAPAAPLLSNMFRMPRLVQPVVTRYRTPGIMVLGGVMLLGTFVLLRARSR
ncbi:MAG: hypothetical protein PVF43_15625 [Candidatus Eiseniibacteriota bacterium]|jgi:hypothetical protein